MKLTVPEHTAKKLADSLVMKLERRCDLKVENKTKAILLQQIRGIICSLESKNGQLVHDGFMAAFDNMRKPSGVEKPTFHRRIKWGASATGLEEK